MTVFSAQIPGSMLFLPPEKPAKKWGSINPSVTSRSHSAASLLTKKPAPEGSFPRETKSSARKASFTTMCSRSTISSPNMYRCSASVVGRWSPVAIRIVTSAHGFPARISFKRSGSVILLGIARVWSLVTSTIFLFPAASSRSRFVPMGCSSACLTSSASPAGGVYAWMRALRTAFSAPSSTCSGRVPLSYGIWISCMVFSSEFQMASSLSP